ncbi:hypothetical protein BC937DRAFT_88428 [Endogone sp. FLAS-F59071]|nr:hypothetical protein BC937DRAFT_88428 [Endogone sp. FLAS-F59071]|eukprot:RUS18713.1 hypothetical protein BC937DRAFT_88428 [Endogone sp. FLAS-F59071]
MIIFVTGCGWKDISSFKIFGGSFFTSSSTMSTFSGSFAESQLAKFGWTKGTGLGKNQDGITKTISLSKKTDTRGVGSGQDQWEFAWWDHLYNKSASAVEVDKAEDGIKVVSKTKSEMRRSKTGIISTVRPSGKATGEEKKKEEKTDETKGEGNDQEKRGEEEEEEEEMNPKAITAKMARKAASALFSKPSSFLASSIPPTDDGCHDDELKDYSQKVSDAELFAACEGRTARKGARGEQPGKLARVTKEYLELREKGEEERKRKREMAGEDDGRAEAKKVKKEKKEGEKEREKKGKKERKGKKEKEKRKKDMKDVESEEQEVKKKKKKAKNTRLEEIDEDVLVQESEGAAKKEKKKLKVKVVGNNEEKRSESEAIEESSENTDIGSREGKKKKSKHGKVRGGKETEDVGRKKDKMSKEKKKRKNATISDSRNLLSLQFKS